MSRTSIRRRFLVTSLASTAIAMLLFVVVSFVIVLVDDADADIRAGDSFQGEAAELIVGAMAIATPLAIAAAAVSAFALSRRSARPLEEAIRAARETTAQDLRRALTVPERDDELRDLVVALNGLFTRLEDGFGALGRFAADASHELRTPLAVMATELEVALRRPRAVEEWEATGRAGLESLRRLSATVDGLLALARAGADEPAARKQVEIVECVDAVMAQLADRAEQRGIQVLGPEPVEARVAANPVMLETALRNLVENALAAVPSGGHIQIAVEVSRSSIGLLIDDDGPGLGADPEALFAPFRSGTASADTTRRNGVGLGLAIARRIAVAHGGQLAAGASPLGGARLRLTLPPFDGVRS